jgi:hypothetical protein
MSTRLVRRALVCIAVLYPAAPLVLAQHKVTGPHGSTATGTVTQRGNKVTATGSATGARGNTVTGTGTVAKTGQGATASGKVTGPKGGTGTASGTSTSNANGSKTVSGTAQGPRGQSKSGTATIPPQSGNSTPAAAKSKTPPSKK